MLARHRLLTVTALAGTALVAAATQASAYESVSINAGYGIASGTIWKASSDNIGFNLSLKDNAPDGACVYLQVQGYRNNIPDTSWTRMTTNTCGNGTTNRYSGTHDVRTTGSLALDGYRVKVCKDLNNKADDCSNPSRITTAGKGTAG